MQLTDRRLKKAEIIPTVIDTFTPLLTISIAWKNASAEYGNSINPSLTQSEPTIKLLDTLPQSSSSLAKHAQLTLAMTDPDAPSRENPEWSEICHWIATSISLQDANANDADPASKVEDVMPYKPPGPPPKTGKHRYVFAALAPLNGTTEALHLVKPVDRQHWGYEGERVGLRKWAEEMGLGVVGECSSLSCVSSYGSDELIYDKARISYMNRMMSNDGAISR